MKKIYLLLMCLAPLICFSQAAKIISTQSNPLSVADPNIAIVNLLDTPTVGGGNLYRFYIAVKDSIKWNVFQIRGLKDSTHNWNDLRYVQSGVTLPNPTYIGSLSAAKVFGLSTVATTGLYSDLSGLPNLSLKYDASNPSGFINGITNGMVLTALGFVPQLQLNGTGFVKASGTTISYDNSTYLTSVPAQSFASLTGKPTTLSGYGITDGITSSALTTTLSSYATTSSLTSGLSGKFNQPTGTTLQYIRGDGSLAALNTSVIPESGSNLYYTDPRARAAISVTTTGTGVATYNNSTGVLNVPTYSLYVPSINAVTRTINSSTFTPSTTLQATLNYSIQISCTATIGGNAAGSVLLQYSTNGGSTWNNAGTVSNSNTVTLAIVLNSVTVQTCILTAIVPPNALCRLVPTTTGTTTITYISGQEVY